MIPVIDVFAGPGGLGEGFVSLGRKEGRQRFKGHLSIEKDSDAHRTLKLRAFFRQFSSLRAPQRYYDVLRGLISPEQLYAEFPKESSLASTEAIQATLGSTPWSEITQQIANCLGGCENWVLIGGPPCQAYSLVGRARNSGNKSYVAEKDQKHFLYREYLRIIADHWPAVFVIENVKGLLSSSVSGERIFDRIQEDLTSPADAIDGKHGRSRRRHSYRLCSLAEQSLFGEQIPNDFVLKAEELGVPQARHRVIIVGIRDDLGSVQPSLLTRQERVSAGRVLRGLPALRSGINDDSDSPGAWERTLRDAVNRRWVDGARAKGGEELVSKLRRTLRGMQVPAAGRGGEFLLCEPNVEYQREWFIDPQLDGVCNHSTRGHITKDLFRYFYAACFAQEVGRSPQLSDFPADLLPRHENVGRAIEGGGLFSDRFRVQLWDRPATTVTCHIAKDGHYYIHPDPAQCRSLTVREAARLQTFPDNYFFTGPRTSQYVQVGNAVPPLLASKIAQKVYDVLAEAGAAV